LIEACLGYTIFNTFYGKVVKSLATGTHKHVRSFCII